MAEDISEVPVLLFCTKFAQPDFAPSFQPLVKSPFSQRLRYPKRFSMRKVPR